MFKLPGLDYDYGALAPTISKQIMELHHDKHHQGYVDKLNAALEQAPDLQSKSLVELLTDLSSVPETIRTAVRNQGGGHYNHSLLWKMMAPGAGGEPSGALAQALAEKYGSFQKFTEEFEAKAGSVFGSGWTWLMPDLSIVMTPLQDNPVMNGGVSPILGVDVWEHAYYLDYFNRRADYLKVWWNVVNWPFVEARFAQNNDSDLAF
jgi:Fe-Mn family superoxide dismutase